MDNKLYKGVWEVFWDKDLKTAKEIVNTEDNETFKKLNESINKNDSLFDGPAAGESIKKVKSTKTIDDTFTK